MASSLDTRLLSINQHQNHTPLISNWQGRADIFPLLHSFVSLYFGLHSPPKARGDVAGDYSIGKMVAEENNHLLWKTVGARPPNPLACLSECCGPWAIPVLFSLERQGVTWGTSVRGLRDFRESLPRRPPEVSSIKAMGSSKSTV